MKQTKLWLATIAALLCSLTASAHDFEVNGIYYNITSSTDLTVAVTYQGDHSWDYDEYLRAVAIPQTVIYDGNTYRVTSIGESAFDNCRSLTSITIPKGVTSIGEFAFYGCSSLTSITIPEGVTSIGEWTFCSCQSLTSITIPESVTSIGEFAFASCSSLTAITIPESVTSIGESAFAGCSSLTAITIPEGVTCIGYSAFSYCSSLTSITIPESVTSIGNGAFESTAWYDNQPNGVIYAGNVLYKYKGTMPANTSVEVREGTVGISPSAFNGCISLTSITIPEGVTSIGNSTFDGCYSLTAITIPESVTEIGVGAFYGCRSLTFITIPEGVTEIGEIAFRGCCFLRNNFINNSSCTSSTNWGANIFDGESDGLFVDDNVVVLCRPYLTSITIPEGVTSIGGEAFYGCSRLTSITIPESVTSIGAYAFYGCSSLTSVNIPEGVTSIGNSTFDGCSSLTSINIPEGVTEIWRDAFNGCSSLAAVHISSVEAWYKISFNNVSSNPLHFAHNLYLNGELVTELVIPEGLTSIGEYTFNGCGSLTSITIPKDVTEIGHSAFGGCVSLKEVVIEDGNEALTLGDNRIFSDSYSYTTTGLFDDCPLECVYLGRNLTYSTSPFNDDDNTLVSVTIGDCVTEIQQSLFRNCCSNLKELTIGKGVRSIGAYAFTNGKALEKITIYAALPPSYDGNGNELFSDATYKNVTLYVPHGSIEKYQVMTGWSRFYNISEMEDGTPEYLIIRQADNGTVGIAVDLGRTYKVCITPSAGWKVHTVTFNGTDITAQLGEDNTLTTPTVTGSSELNVAYEQVGGSKVEDACATAVKVCGYEGIITVEGCPEGENISIYTIDGALVAQEKAESAGTHIAVETEQLYVVQVAGKVVKIRM